MPINFSELLQKPTHPFEPSSKKTQSNTNSFGLNKMDQSSIYGSQSNLGESQFEPSSFLRNDFDLKIKDNSREWNSSTLRSNNLDRLKENTQNGLPQTFVPSLVKNTTDRENENRSKGIAQEIVEDFNDFTTSLKSHELFFDKLPNKNEYYSPSQRLSKSKVNGEKSLTESESTWMEENHSGAKKHITIDIKQYEADLLSLQQKQDYMFKALKNIRELQTDLRLKQDEIENARESVQKHEVELQKKEIALKQKELQLLDQESKLQAQFLKQEQLQTYITEAENSLQSKKEQFEKELREKINKIKMQEEEFESLKNSFERIQSERIKDLEEKERSIIIRMERITEKDIQLQNMILLNETGKKMQDQFLKKESEYTTKILEKDAEIKNLKSELLNFNNELKEKNSIIMKLSEINPSNSNSENFQDNLIAKVAELENITLDLLEKKQELEKFEDELLLKQSEMVKIEDVEKLNRLQTISKECRQVLLELHARERSLNHRESKLKEMVQLVQSIQNRQQIAKEELNRAIQRDEKKIQEKAYWIESKEKSLEKTQKTISKLIDELININPKEKESIISILKNLEQFKL